MFSGLTSDQSTVSQLLDAVWFLWHPPLCVALGFYYGLLSGCLRPSEAPPAAEAMPSHPVDWPWVLVISLFLIISAALFSVVAIRVLRKLADWW